VLALGMALIMWAAEGTGMITSGTVTLIAVLVFAGMLIDSVVLFGPAENDPGVDRLLRYRPHRPAGAEQDLRASSEIRRPQRRARTPLRVAAKPAGGRPTGQMRHLPDPPGQLPQLPAA
jgi:hypothetical protein